MNKNKTRRTPRRKPVETLTARQRPLWQFSVFDSDGNAFQGHLRVAANTAEEAAQVAIHACVQIGRANHAVLYPVHSLLLDETVWDLERKVTDG